MNVGKAKMFLAFGKKFFIVENLLTFSALLHFQKFCHISNTFWPYQHVVKNLLCQCNLQLPFPLGSIQMNYPVKSVFLSSSVQALGGKYATKIRWISPEMGTSFFNNMLSQTTSIEKKLLEWKYVSILVRNQHLSLIK